MRREASGPALVDHQHRNVTDLLAHRVRTAPEHVAFGRRGAEGSVDVVAPVVTLGLPLPPPVLPPRPSAAFTVGE